MKTKMKNKLARPKKLLSFVLEESVDRRERYWLVGEDEGGSVTNLCTDLELFSFLLAIDVHMEALHLSFFFVCLLILEHVVCWFCFWLQRVSKDFDA